MVEGGEGVWGQARMNEETARMPSRSRLASLVLTAMFGALLTAPALAQYPTRAITLIVPYAPGGGNDVMARIVADKMSAALGQQIVVENRGGAGGSIATRQVAGASPTATPSGSAAPERSRSIRPFTAMWATTRARISPRSA